MKVARKSAEFIRIIGRDLSVKVTFEPAPPPQKKGSNYAKI